MADRSKKESTPPPLLLMPPGGGLTLTPPEQPNILMPIVQNASPFLSPEEEAEADSFVGQSVAPTAPGIQPSYFSGSAGNGHDLFSQVGNESLPAEPSGPAVLGPPTIPGPGSVAANLPAPPPSAPFQNTFNSPGHTVPPKSASPAGSGNMYRQKGGRPQYVAPPSNFSPQPPRSSPFAPPTSQPPTAMVPPMTSTAMQGVPPFPSPPSNQPPLSHDGAPGIPFTPSPPQHQDNPGTYTGGLFFQPVRYHWCYREDQQGIEIWRPFSTLDSMHLEMAYNTKLQESPNTIVCTNGGRYDVHVGQRIRTPVYWNSAPVEVRRCSWFFKREGDNRYIPYEEDFARRLEDEYKKAMDTNGWHRRLEFPGNIVIVMHNANVIVQFPASSPPDEYGNVQGDQMRPRVVKRGVDDFASIVQGERPEVEHLVFFVPGIEDMSGGRSVESLVDDFRSNTLSLLESHFSQAYQAKTVNRVEFLPVIWTQALEDNVTGLKEQMESITLPSTAKLRHFINNSLVDTLFYTSPLYCQKICDTVGSEMNRMFHIFLERNQSFSGDVSVAGHSLGAVILFDLLLNQRLPGEPAPADDLEEELDLSQNEASEASSEAGEEKEEEEEQTLEDLLSKIGLQEKANLFHNEQIDAESLLMCSEQDLKDIGLQMGPRKKLLGFLHEEKTKKDKKAKEETEKKIIKEMEKKKQSAISANNFSQLPKGSAVSAQYLQGSFGAGQLKIRYHQLDFTPNALYALGSPIAVFLTLRGIQDLGEFFQLPTCPRVYNIFHPFDPMAFRVEPLIRQNTAIVRPVQIPHYKGRKRLHLEFKEAVTRYGTDIKQKIVDSFKSTWAVINDFARAHKSEAKPSSMENEVKSEMDQMMSHLAQQHSEDDRASVSSAAEEEIHMGQLNEGSRVDYVLQEGPLESFNDYLFALASHSCYWESEDTALLMLKEIFMPLGIRPVMPGASGVTTSQGLPPSRESSLPPRQFSGPPPPMTGAKGLQATQLPPPSSSLPPASFPPPGPILQPMNPASEFHASPLKPAASMTGPPPPMFSPSSVPTSHMQPGIRRSPYVPPDYSNLPMTNTASMTGAGTPPPPMGSVPIGGFRKARPS